jgi:hypothetical protein
MTAIAVRQVEWWGQTPLLYLKTSAARQVEKGGLTPPLYLVRHLSEDVHQ